MKTETENTAAEGRTVIEVNGVKMEVDLRHARRVEHFRVGDAVKILKNDGHGSAEVYPGVIVGFEAFEKLPTIVVAYLNVNWSGAGIELAYVNKASGDKYELVASDEDSHLAVSKSRVLAYLDKEIEKHELEVSQARDKRRFFLERFGAYFPRETADAETEPC